MLFNKLCLFLSLGGLIGSLYGNSGSDLVPDNRLNEIQLKLKQLPTRAAYPVGGLGGYKWSKKCPSPWVDLTFPHPIKLDSLALVPLATYQAGRVKTYAMAEKVKITLRGPEKIVFEGDTIDKCREAHPLFLEFENSENDVTGIRVEFLSHEIKDPYLALSEIFAFSNGLNVALSAKVHGNSDIKENILNNMASNLVDGQSTLGLPIINKEQQSKIFGFNIRKFKTKDPAFIEFIFEKPSYIHEVRLFSLYAPVNEMLLEQYGYGFPVSFRLLTIDENNQPLQVLHKGHYHNPQRNLACFYTGHKAAGIRLYVDEFYTKLGSQQMSFALSEIQIINDENVNIAIKSDINFKNIPSSSDEKEYHWKGWLIDQQTPKGMILDLQKWLRELSQYNSLKLERETLLNLQGKKLAQRNFWIQIIVSMFGLSIILAYYLWLRSKQRQNQRLSIVRKDIANDLHDEIGSNLASIRLIMSRFKSDRKAVTIQEILDESEEALREMVWALSPQKMNLIEKLQESTNRLLSEHKVNLKIEDAEAWENLHLKDRQHVVFWFKEALNNIQKHAHAESVEILIQQKDSEDHFEIIIKDDGEGMDLTPFKDDYEHLARLKARALKLSGEFFVNSHPDKGCEVRLKFKSQKHI